MNVEGEDAPLDSGFTDLVHQAISASPTFNARYAVVFSSPTHRIYERTVN